MSEEKCFHNLQNFKQALLVDFGIVSTLLIIELTTGSAFYPIGSSIGWAALWLLTTLGGIPLGIIMLISSTWRKLPLTQRRGTAMGYLLTGFINLTSLALELRWSTPCFFIIPFIYGLMLFAVYARVYADKDMAEDDLFP